MSGRMIQPEIGLSEKVGSLSPKALSLFCLLIPHLNAHGKMIAGAGYVKDLACPRVKWLTPKTIEACLREISTKTNLKHFKINGLWYLHSLNWAEHQPGLRRLGPDKLPCYEKSRTISKSNAQDAPGSTIESEGIPEHTPGLLPDHSRITPEQVPPELEVEFDIDKDKDVDVKVAPLSLESLISKHKDNPAYKDLDVEIEFYKAKTWYETRKQRLTERKLIGWLNRIDKTITVPDPKPQPKPMHPQVKKALEEADKPTDDPVDPKEIKKLVDGLRKG